MSKTVLRIAMVPMIIDLIKKNQNVSESEALDLFYNSSTYKNYIDPETGLYGQSPLNIYGLFLAEKNK